MDSITSGLGTILGSTQGGNNLLTFPKELPGRKHMFEIFFLMYAQDGSGGSSVLLVFFAVGARGQLVTTTLPHPPTSSP